MPSPLVFIVAGETSGDALGGKLMQALKARRPDLRFAGVGGETMTAAGLTSAFPMAEIAVMGFLPVIARLPLLVRRIAETAEACIAARPDVLVIVDSPDFTHRVARKVRARAPGIPIVDYVSPTVWAWRPGRAKAMRAYVDQVLALLPFEPEAHRRLGGPPCAYVGHPLIERLRDLRPGTEAETAARDQGREVLLMPGSRRSEVSRLLPVIGETAARIAGAEPGVTFVLPVVAHVAQEVQAEVARWSIQPRLIFTEAEKLAAFRRARAALVASGTATLELALAGVPMVTLYKASRLEEAIIRLLIQVRTGILANLILNERAIPEFHQQAASAENLSAALLPLIRGGPERDAQRAAFDRLEIAMQVPGDNPSAAAAELVLARLKA